MAGSKTKDVIIRGVYRHFKGNYYIVDGVAIHSEDRSEYVIYQALDDPSKLYIRPKAMFLEKHDGVHPRFEYVSDQLEQQLCK